MYTEYQTIHDLPEDFNSERLGENLQGFYRDSERLNKDLRKSLFWSLRLMMETDGGWIYSHVVKGYKYTAYGLFKVKSSHNSFGVIIYADAKHYWYNKLHKLAKKFFRKSDLPHSIIVDGYQFPVVIRHIKVHPQSRMGIRPNMQNPRSGTAACFASSTLSAYRDGVLTVKHVVGDTLNKKIDLSCGCIGEVVALGPGSIDAAVIQSDCVSTKEPYLQRMTPIQHVAAQIPVEFSGAESNFKIEATIRQITDTRGIYNSPSLPISIFLSDYGRPGDSGALVTDTHDSPLGLYIGKYQSIELKEVGGLAQHLYQVSEIMRLDLYSYK